MRLGFTAFGLVVFSISTPAMADSCDPAKVQASNAMNGKIDGKVEELRATQLALKGQNTAVAQQLVTSLQEAIDAIEKNRGAANNGAGEEAYLQCKDKQVPLQTAVDLGVIAATGGLAVLLPPKAWHIDVGELERGNVLGGQCSFARNPLGHGC